MSQDVAHKRSWQIFEVVCGIPFLMGLALQWIVPLSFPRGPLSLVTIFGGVSLIILGTVLVFLARWELTRHDQPTDPGQPTSKLVTTGVFSVSRNPLYLGGICILVGIALAFNLPWGLVLLLPAVVACQTTLIAPEETYLAARFGEEYHRYAATVSRWVGRAQRSKKP